MEHEHQRHKTARPWQEKEDEGQRDAGEGKEDTGPEKKKIQSLYHSLDEVTGKMKLNMEGMLQRDMTLDHLNNIASQLKDSSKDFLSTSSNVTRSYKRKNMKLVIAIVTVVILIIIIIIVALLITGVIPIKTTP